VQRREHRRVEGGGHRDRQVVQAVVVDDVERAAQLAGQAQHQVEVGVVLVQPLRGRHADVGPRRIADARQAHVEHLYAERGVRARSGEQRHLVAAPP
jgi:hypothetical protein